MHKIPDPLRSKALDPSLDTEGLHRTRARAENILSAQVAKVGSIYELSGGVGLSLVDQFDPQQVTVKRQDDGYMISASPAWLDSSSDVAVCATFTHELGHVALGHCDEGAKRTWRRQALAVRTAFGVLAALLLISGALRLLGQHHSTQIVAIFVASSVALWLSLAGLLWSHQERLRELDADLFIKRFAQPQAFIDDLARENPRLNNRLYRFMAWFDSLVNAHPTLESRARALGISHY